MKYFLPTYEQSKEIVASKGIMVFYETVNYIDGYKVSVFNYRLPKYMDFLVPVEGKNYDAREFRGLTYVFNEDGTVFNRYLMLNKFWNVDQVTETLFDKVKNKKIKSVYNKEDGSLISFIRLPNGKVVAKTKMGFDNDQAVSANELLAKNESIFKFVNECLDNDLVTMWEYVSFKNKIVLDYKDTNLILLRVRNNKTGEYVDVEQFRGLGFDVVKTMSIGSDLESIMKWLETAVDIEGVVITFEDDMMVKAKSKWYCARHHLLTEESNREDYIIEMVLKETIDDLKAQLNPVSDVERIAWIENIEVIVRNFLAERVAEVEELVSKYTGDLKYFAIAYKKDKNFSLAINVVRGKCDAYTAVKEWLLVQTKHLEQARSFINEKGFKRK